MHVLFKKLILFTLIFFMFSLKTYATSWPLFVSADKKFLLDHDLIEIKNCPKGQGKLREDIVLQIAEFFCRTYCPNEWNWIAKHDQRCHDLSTDFNFKRYEIKTYQDSHGHGTTLFSKVTAIYGNTNQDTFKLTFKTPKENWYCYEMNPESHFITCAQDT